ALYQSAQADEQAVVVGLLSEAARNYFELRNDERQLEITAANLENQKKTRDIITAQVQGAMASDFDLSRASAQVSTTESLIPAIQTARDAALNRLNVLVGAPPGSKNGLFAASPPLKPLDPSILLAAPATVLANRPDVRAAERRLAAALMGRREAIAEFFPKITLLGFYGAQTSPHLLTAPWTLEGTLVQPILNFGLLRSQLKIATARQSQAFYSYQETVLEALENMDNALSSFAHEYARNQSLAAAAAQDQRAADLAELQFKGGFASLLDVLVAQANALSAQSAQAASDAELRKDLTNIYAAAGGGWDAPEAR
ncbi:MAG TPA: TolC family protein, partial [Elusimicrobiota bacterium]|nr:TolC family protein [Elusimicrobiota bacterium]